MLDKLKNIPPKYKKALFIPLAISLVANLAFGLFILTGVFAFYGLSGEPGAIGEIFIEKVPMLILNGIGYGLFIAVPIIIVLIILDSFKKRH